MPEEQTRTEVSVPYEITLLSNIRGWFNACGMVSVPYEITLLSNSDELFKKFSKVSVPYEITLLSNFVVSCILKAQFQYLMKLHYSQTDELKTISFHRFQYLMKLHYSQTDNELFLGFRHVSVPYEITLLSNLK